MNERHTLDQVRTLDRFLTSIEKRAFRIARIAVHHDDDALDIVQDAMLQLARRYAQRPSEEWRPLFYRILQNRIRDCQRRRKVRAGIMAWLPWRTDEQSEAEAVDGAPDAAPQPSERVMTGQALHVLEQARIRKNFRRFQSLPAEQRKELRQRFRELTPQQRKHLRENPRPR